MYQSILILSILSLSLSSAASTKAITNLSNKFESQAASFFASEITAKNIQSLTGKLVKSGNAIYSEIVSIEQKETLDNTIEGNQLALDLEYLDILVEFADSKMDADSCAYAKHDTELEDNQEPVIIGIRKVLNKLCK